MARIRTIKPEFFRHAGLFDAEVETGLPLRIAFAGLWSACDREGRFTWRVRELKLDALPFDEVDFSRVLDALWTRGHVAKYSIDDVDYGFIPSWQRHQVINNRESASVLPEPVDSSIVCPQGTRAPRVAHASPTPLVHAQGEGKGKEGKGVAHASLTRDFESGFWIEYPNHKAKSDALKAWLKLKPTTELQQTILEAIAVQRTSDGWMKEGGKFIPLPSTWLNGKRWADEVVAAQADLMAGSV